MIKYKDGHIRYHTHKTFEINGKKYEYFSPTEEVKYSFHLGKCPCIYNYARIYDKTIYYCSITQDIEHCPECTTECTRFIQYVRDNKGLPNKN